MWKVKIDLLDTDGNVVASKTVPVLTVHRLGNVLMGYLGIRGPVIEDIVKYFKVQVMRSGTGWFKQGPILDPGIFTEEDNDEEDEDDEEEGDE